MRRDGRAHSVKGLTMAYKAAISATRAKYAMCMPKRRIREHIAGERQARAYPPYPHNPSQHGGETTRGHTRQVKKSAPLKSFERFCPHKSPSLRGIEHFCELRAGLRLGTGVETHHA